LITALLALSASALLFNKVVIAFGSKRKKNDELHTATTRKKYSR
jgi:predicted membrane-bound mannosyltransferase